MLSNYTTSHQSPPRMEPIVWLDYCVFFFVFCGTFGNINVIFCVIRNKTVRTKCGCLTGVLSAVHLICLMSELYRTIFSTRYLEQSQYDCFKSNIVYNWAIIFQTTLYFVMAFDILFSISHPIVHLTIGRYKYMATLLIPCFMFATSCIIINYLFIVERKTAMCIFLITAAPLVYQSIATLLLIINLTTVALVCLTVYLAVFKTKSVRGNRRSGSQPTNSFKEKMKMFRSTFVLTISYIGSWIVTGFIVNVFIYRDNTQANVQRYLPFLILTILPTYCQTYFITFCRCPRFRKVYLKQLQVLTCGHFKKEASLVQNSSQNRKDTSSLTKSSKLLHPTSV